MRRSTRPTLAVCLVVVTVGCSKAPQSGSLGAGAADSRVDAAPRVEAAPPVDAAPPEEAHSVLALSDHGPHIHWERTLAGRPLRMEHERGRFLMLEAEKKVVAYDLARGGPPVELLRVPGIVEGRGSVHCAARFCLAESAMEPDGQPDGMFHRPRKLLAFDLAAGTHLEAKGPWKTSGGFAPVVAGAGVEPMAPDGSFAVLQQLVMLPQPPHRAVLFVVTRAGRVTGPVDLGLSWWEVQAVTDATILVRLGPSSGAGPGAHEGDAGATYVQVDARSGETHAVPAPAGLVDGRVVALSPDGTRTAACANGALVVHELATGKERRFDAGKGELAPLGRETTPDRGPCVGWANASYLWFRTPFLGFVDVRSGAVNRAVPGADTAFTLEFDKDFGHVVDDAIDTARVGRVTQD
jgi:hypothetical protein